MRAKRILYVLGTMALILLFAALDYQSISVEADVKEDWLGLSRKNVELNYYTWSDEIDYMPSLISAFEESYPGYRINLYTFNSFKDEYYAKMHTLLLSGEDIDVLGVNSSSYYSQFYGPGYLEPLRSYITKYNFDLRPYGTLLAQIDVNGEYYALPHRKTSWVLYYNKDIFDREGIPYPEQLTWQEFAELAHRLTYEKEDGAMHWGCSGYNISANNDSHFYAAQMGESLIDDELPHYREGLEILNQIYYTKQSSLPFPQTRDNGGAVVREAFQRGEIAMMVGGEWNIAALLSAKEDNKTDIHWDITYFPIPEDAKKGTTIGTATSTGICSYSEKKEEAFLFLSYMCGEAGATAIAKKGILPAFQSQTIMQTYLQVAPYLNLEVIFKSKVKEEMPNETASSALIEATKSATAEYLLGNTSMEETVENWNQVRKEIIQYYKAYEEKVK